MLEHLSKLAARSAQLRTAALRKEAALLGAATQWASGKAKSLAIGGVVAGALASPTVVAKTKEFKSGFDPNSQKQMMGHSPTPPGV